MRGFYGSDSLNLFIFIRPGFLRGREEVQDVEAVLSMYLLWGFVPIRDGILPWNPKSSRTVCGTLNRYVLMAITPSSELVDTAI